MTDSSSKKPVAIAYHVRQGGGEDESFWTRIGAVWDHKDGKGQDVVLEMLPAPVDGKYRITLREPGEKPA